MKLKIISVIGYSGSGKTNFITTAIKFLKENLKFNVAVVKNIKHHQIDEKGKDSNKFSEAGASYSVIRNEKNEFAIFFKNEEIRLEELFKWLENGPFKLDIVITEGFRNLNQPTVLCSSNLKEIKEQLSENVKMISGVICSKDNSNKKILDLPIIDINSHFSRFLDIFGIK